MSGRTHGKQRICVEACVRVDAAMLRRAGLLSRDTAPRAWGFTYSDARGNHSCSVLAYALPGPPAVELRIQRPGEPAPAAGQIVRLSWRSCNYGGERAWLICPRCGRRSFRLYFYMHTVDELGWRFDRFSCRACLPVTYALRNMRGQWLAMERAGKIVKQLGGNDWGLLPSKPRGMRWKTYARLAGRWEKNNRAANEAFIAYAFRRFGIGGESEHKP